MLERNVDVAIIGAGTAGLAAYRNALKHSDSVVIIESGPYGTTCARVGCMPSKLLIAAAESAHSLDIADNFGIEMNSGYKVNGKRVMDRVKSERDRFVGFVLDSVEKINPENRIRGYAKFLDNNTIQIDEHTILKIKSAVIATGSSSNIPPFLKELGDRLVTNDEVFSWDDLPKSVAVFGSGVIGLEIGQALSRLGVRVKMFGRGGTIGPLSHPDIKKYAYKTFSEEFYLDPDVKDMQLSKDENGVKLSFTDSNGEKIEDTVDYVLAATGRTPNVSRLGLENTSIRHYKNGVPEFNRKTMQIENSNIFIAGDVNNDIPLLHEASDEGVIAGMNAGTYPNVKEGKRRTPLGIVFTDPQIAIIGKNCKELNASTYVIGEVSFKEQGRSRVMLKNKGLLHIYADIKTGLFLGAEIFGPQAEHLGHLLSWACQKNMTISEMLEMPFYHPVIEEGLRTALRNADEKIKKFNS